ncbi:hypothetical protein [Burkholderia cenocepacia]|uniref:hypothetical protein n=1 Tax=Burkholderia cenocepacia TaxID=95486 RepID=UPI0020131185|nr:hypothetical protein [Burkholderia cenocepacia]
MLTHVIVSSAQSLSRGYKGDHGGQIGQEQANYFREKVPLREIAWRTVLSRNTVRRWLRQTDAVEPKYPKHVSPSVIGDWAAQVTGWLHADSHRPKRDRRTALFMFEAIRAEGFQKKSPSGIATPKPDGDLVRERLKAAEAHAQGERR